MAPPAEGNINRIKLKKCKDNVRDPRFNKSGYKKCLQCGRCTASCPAAYMYDDFRPRDMMRRFSRGEAHSRKMGELIWKCGQCYACRARCPRNCNMPLAVLALRTEAVQDGTAPESIMKVHVAIKSNLGSKGVTMVPAMFDDDLLRSFGARTYGRCSGNLVKRARLGYALDDARRVPVPDKSLQEIRDILKLTGYTGEKQ
jgi:heterodisulfide reductase subunit C1